MSHSHLDHLANAYQFAKSTWLVRPVEHDILSARIARALDAR